jgi:hypothetical protein
VEEALRAPEEQEASLLRLQRPEPMQEQGSLQLKVQAQMQALRRAVELRPQVQPTQELAGWRLEVLPHSEAAKPPRQEERRQQEGAPGLLRQPRADEQ